MGLPYMCLYIDPPGTIPTDQHIWQSHGVSGYYFAVDDGREPTNPQQSDHSSRLGKTARILREDGVLMFVTHQHASIRWLCSIPFNYSRAAQICTDAHQIPSLMDSSVASLEFVCPTSPWAPK